VELEHTGVESGDERPGVGCAVVRASESARVYAGRPRALGDERKTSGITVLTSRSFDAKA